ncbi:MAG: cation diffusion facilitator family transporter [Actinomycetota bacterium]
MPTPPPEVGAAQRSRGIKRVLWAVLGANVGVAVAKLLMGMALNSASMVADAFHSFVDGSSNVIGLTGMRVAERPPDSNHPYGHRKFETFASLGIAAMLLVATVRIAVSALHAFKDNVQPRPEVGGFVVMLATMGVNTAVTVIESRRGRALDSSVLVSDARHTLSDILVSFSVLISLGLARLGHPGADPIIALLIAGVIAYTSLRIFRDTGLTLSDAIAHEPDQVITIATGVPGVAGCHNVRSRRVEGGYYLDLHLTVDGKLPLSEAHSIATEVEHRLIRELGGGDVVVHVEPTGEETQDPMSG